MTTVDWALGTGHRRSARPRGMTLIELVLVLVIISVVGALVAPLFSNSLPSLRVKRSADEFLAAARKAHQDAALTAHRQRILLKTTAEEEANPKFWLAFEPRPLEEPGIFRKLSGGWGDAFELPDGVSFSSTEGAQTDPATGDLYIEFSPEGTATEATITFSNDRGDSVTVKINAATGVASIPPEEAP